MEATNRIKAVLAEKRLTSKCLSLRQGKSENTISRWCSNKVQPTLDNLYEVAEILVIEVRSLIAPTKQTTF